MHGARLPHDADPDFLILQCLRHRLVGRQDLGARLPARHQALLARLVVGHRSARGQRRRHQRKLILDVDDAELAAVPRVERIGEAGGRRCDQLRVIENDLARVDMPHAVGISHLRQQVLRIGDLRVVDGQAQAGLVHLVHLRRRESLQVAGAARQPCFGAHLGAAFGIATDVMHDFVFLRDHQRRVDILG